MHHGPIAREVARGLLRLRDRIAEGNIPFRARALFRAVTAKGLKAPAGVLGITHGSNLALDARYDQILVADHFPESVTGKAGVLDIFKRSFQPLYEDIADKSDIELTYEMSDHLPLWIEMYTDDDSWKLDQIINPKR